MPGRHLDPREGQTRTPNCRSLGARHPAVEDAAARVCRRHEWILCRPGSPCAHGRKAERPWRRRRRCRAGGVSDLERLGRTDRSGHAVTPDLDSGHDLVGVPGRGRRWCRRSGREYGRADEAEHDEVAIALPAAVTTSPSNCSAWVDTKPSSASSAPSMVGGFYCQARVLASTSVSNTDSNCMPPGRVKSTLMGRARALRRHRPSVRGEDDT